MKMDHLKKGEYIQVLDREDGMYWDAIVRDLNAEQDLVTVWIPLCKLKMTYHACDTRKQVEERPLQRDSMFKRTDLRLLVRKRKIVYKKQDSTVTGEVKVNDPYEAYFELKHGDLVPYESVLKIKEMSDDEDEDNNNKTKAVRKANRQNSASKVESAKRKNEQLTDRAKMRPKVVQSSQTSAGKSASLKLVKRAGNFKSKQLSKDVNNHAEKSKPSPEKSKLMVDANINTIESFSVTETGGSETTENSKMACPIVDQPSFVPEMEPNRANDDLQDSTLAQQMIGQTNFQLPLFNNGVTNPQIPTDLSNGNAPMVNLDFGTSSTSIYYPSTSSNTYPVVSSFQCSPSKGLAGFTPGLTFQSALRGTSVNYLPYTLPDNLQMQTNNNLDAGNQSQLARLSDLVEKAFYEVKEQSILLRRMLEGQETMVNHLAKIVQGISEATQVDDANYTTQNRNQPVQMMEMNRTSLQNGSGYVATSNDRLVECDLQNVPISERNGLDLTV